METLETTEQEWYIVREDSPDVIKDLSELLSKKNIPSQISLAPGCSSGSCALRYVLLVTKENAPASLKSIDEYFMQLHPELKLAQDNIDQGKCPACGSTVADDDRECSDCGLMLILD